MQLLTGSMESCCRRRLASSSLSDKQPSEKGRGAEKTFVLSHPVQADESSSSTSDPPGPFAVAEVRHIATRTFSPTPDSPANNGKMTYVFSIRNRPKPEFSLHLDGLLYGFLLERFELLSFSFSICYFVALLDELLRAEEGANVFCAEGWGVLEGSRCG